MRYKIITIAVLTALTGCMSIPKIQEKERLFLEPSSIQLFDTSIKRNEWWKVFQDEQLNSLVTEVLENNKDLSIAQLNLEKVGESINYQQSFSNPQIDFNGSAKRERLSESSFYPPPLGGSIINYGQIGFNGFINLDLFGKNSSLIQEKKYQQEALNLNKEALEFALSIQTIKLYGYWNYLKNLESTLNKQLLEQELVVKMAQDRLDQGFSIKSELLDAENLLKTFKNDKTALQLNQKIVINELSKLIGKTIIDLSITPSNLLSQISKIEPISKIDSKIIENKPDIKYYLFNIYAQREKMEALKADFYPSIALSGQLELQKIGFSNLLKFGNIFSAIGPSFNLPILDAGRITSNYKIGGIDLNIFIENYNKAVINAYYDLDTEIYKNKISHQVLYNQLTKQFNEQEKFNIVEKKSSLGKVSQYELINHHIAYLSSTKETMNAQLYYFNQHIDLMNSMGGTQEFKK